MLLVIAFLNGVVRLAIAVGAHTRRELADQLQSIVRLQVKRDNLRHNARHRFHLGEHCGHHHAACLGVRTEPLRLHAHTKYVVYVSGVECNHLGAESVTYIALEPQIAVFVTIAAHSVVIAVVIELFDVHVEIVAVGLPRHGCTKVIVVDPASC